MSHPGNPPGSQPFRLADSGPAPGLSFTKRNLVAIVMIPALILVHYGWSRIQENDAFVSKEERKGQPIVLAAKHFLGKYFGKDSGNEGDPKQ